MTEGVKKCKCTRDELREKVVAAAGKAFATSGIKNVRMDDIANSLAISKRTLYELFSDKEQLLIEVFLLHQREVFDYMEKVVSGADNVLEIIFAFYKRKLGELGQTNPCFLRDLRKYPKVLEFMKESKRMSDKAASVYFEKGIEQGIFRDDINFDIINQATYLQFEMLVYSDLTENYPLAEIYREITMLYIRGITTEKGQKMVDDFLTSMKEI